ncbi:MAG: type II toxin-antitoxin system VapC family toxin [Planctomycetota bacterium]|nr:type II toxin-antitoxin system VapC family toxin [Planctomycetota bacterium]
MPTHLLDTSVFCQPLRPRPLPSVVRRWERLGDGNLATSVLVEAEVQYGIHLKGSRKLAEAYRTLLRGRLPALPVDLEVADAYAGLKAQLHQRGRPVPDLDLLIAATAQVHGLVVATLNPRHFLGLEGVSVEDWSGV